MNKKTSGFAGRAHPWGFFALFLLTDAFISYYPLSDQARLLVFVLGIALPLAAAARFLPPEPASKRPLFYQEFLPPLSPWAWATMGIGVVFLHFYRLDGSWPWFRGDEGLNGMYAIQFSEKRDWKLFYSLGQFPTHLIWASGFLFQWLSSPFLAARFVPALVSTAVVPLGYFGSRTAFSKSFSFLAACLMAASLWMFASGRTYLSTVVLPWEMVCLWLMGALLAEKNLSRRNKLAAGLGFTVGLGYLVSPHWPFVLLLVALTLFAGTARKPARHLSLFLFFGGAYFLAILPFAAAVLRGDYSLSIQFFSALGHPISLPDRLAAVFSYFSSFLWGPWKGVGVYFGENFERFNPVLAAVFFTGILQMLRNRSRRFTLWLCLALFICFAPAFFSIYVEMLRVIVVLPVLFLVAAWGLSGLLIETRVGKRKAILFLLLTASVLFDSERVWGFYRHPEQSAGGIPVTQTREENKRAYLTLRDISRSMGPGLVFTEFLREGNDHSLFMTTYSFNAAENPKLDPVGARWAAILANRHYHPFLSQRFPGAQWYRLGQGPDQAGDTMLGVVPLTAENTGVFKPWVAVHHHFRRMQLSLADISRPATYDAARKTLEEGRAMVEGDRFLEACYWEIMAQFYYEFGYQSHYGDLAAALKQAVEEGYPAAHLNYKLGSLLLRKGDLAGSRKAFEAALRVEPGYPEALNALWVLEDEQKALK